MERKSTHRPTMPSLRLATVIASLVLVVVACGTENTGSTNDDSDSDDGVSVQGRTFWSTAVTEAGAERALVDGTKITVNFDEGSGVGANAGCNSIGGDYALDGDLLVTGDLFSTEIGCSPELHAQDEFVIGVLQGRPTMTLDGDQLVLETVDARIELLDAAVANPDQPIIGPVWEVTGFLDGDVAQTFAVDQPATLVFQPDSTMVLFDGCGEFTVSVEMSDGSVGGPVEGDGELQIAPLADPGDTGCGAPQDYREAVRSVLSGQAFYTIEGSNLTITNTSGSALMLSIR